MSTTNGGLTPKQQRFVDEYLIDLDPKRAAISAGYAESTANCKSFGWVSESQSTKPHVLAAIAVAKAERSERTRIDADWVLTRLADEATADLADLYADDGALKPIGDWPLIWRQGLVSGLDVGETFVEGAKLGQVTKLKLSDRIKRIELIGKHVGVGAFAERKEVGGIGGGPVQVEDLSVTEAARRIAFALAKAANTPDPATDE